MAQDTFIPGVQFAQWKVPTRFRVLSREDFLFHRSEDPGQARNLWATEPRQRQRMLDLLRELLAQEGLPSEQHIRLGLQA